MKIKTAKQIFNFFPGRWKINRSIIFSHASSLKAKGHAVFSLEDNNTILYKEEIIFLSLKPNVVGKQKYIYKYNPATSSLCKYFWDGRLFYQLNILQDNIEAGHLCMQDYYQSNYVFESNIFKLTYSVKGPEKSYDIESVYTRP